MVICQRIFGCGSAQPMHFFQLYGSMTAFFEKTIFSPKQELYRAAFLKRGEKSRLESIRPESCREILSRCREEGVSLLTPASPNYPECLRKIDAPPAVLYCKGELPPVDEIPAIAVVGFPESLSQQPAGHPGHLPPAGPGRGGGGQRRGFGGGQRRP